MASQEDRRSTKSTVRSSLSSDATSDKAYSFQDGETLAEPLDERPRFVDFFFRRKDSRSQDLDAIATRRSVYDDPALSKHYWPTEKYENLHRFDPSARWTFREEKV